MKKNGIIKFAVLMIAVILFLPLFVQAQTVQAQNAPVHTVGIDYGIPSSDKNITVSDGDLITLLVGDTVCRPESAYLKEKGEYSFTYCDSVPQSGISAEWEEGTLYIYLKPWGYTASNGETVSWIPQSVNVNGIEHKCIEENGTYKCVFADEFTASDNFDIATKYTAQFTFDKDFYNGLINGAYNAAEELSEEVSAYEYESLRYSEAESAYFEYQKEFERYEDESEAFSENEEAWRAYEEKLAAYNEYLTQKQIYEDQSEKYSVYIEELGEYSKKNELYEQYLNDKAQYSENLVIYRNYTLQINARTEKLEVINNMFVCDSLGRSLYYTLMGDTVATVVDHKNEIVNYAMVDAKAVDAAGQCTENLKKLLSNYKECSTDKEKYLYYESHYGEIRDNLKNLYECLYSFYSNKMVRSILAQNEKLERYRMFVSQLYSIVTAIDDSMTRDPDWKLGVSRDDMFGIDHYLEACHIPEDRNNSSPSNLPGWPMEVPEPTEPTAVEKPVPPKEVSSPGNPPQAVIEPKEPAKMDCPTPPTEVPPPGNPPAKVEMTASEKAILSAFFDGEITKRQSVSENFTLTMTKTVDKFVEDLGKHYVTFICDGEVVSYANVAEDENVIAPNPPEKISDAYIYTFVGWVDDDGNYWKESTRVTADTEFYAKYTGELRKYKITWIVNDRTETVEAEYGSVPEYTGDTSKPDSPSKVYTFIGWDNKPAKVTGEATYSALYSESDRYYNVTWQIDGNTVTEQYLYGETPQYKGKTVKSHDEKYIYTFGGWSSEITPVSCNVTYVGEYIAEAIVPAPDGSALETRCENAVMSVSTSEKSINVKNLVLLASQTEYGLKITLGNGTVSVGSYDVNKLAEQGIESFSLSYMSDDAGNISVLLDMGKDSEGIDLTVEFPTKNRMNATYYRLNDDGSKEKTVCRDGVVSLKLSRSGEVRLIAEYSAKLIEGENGRSVLSAYSASVGERVTLNSSSLDYGYYISNVKVRQSLTGEYIDFDMESMSFAMPAGGADVEVVYSRRIFTVTFMHDGKVLSSQTYYMGDEVNMPNVLQTIVDEEYYYTFAGWDKPVTAVVADTTYNAIYNKTVLANRSTMREYGYENRTYMYLIYGGVALTLIGGGTTLVLVLVKRKKRKAGK